MCAQPGTVNATTMQDASLLLLEILSRRIPSAAGSWRERVEQVTGIGARARLVREAPDAVAGETSTWFDVDHFLSTFTAAARALGKAPLALQADERDALEAALGSRAVEGWRLDELGRVTLLALVSRRLPEMEVESLLWTCYQQGDSRERQALLRALPLVTGAERLLSLAVDACRTNELPVFEAIACENRYPAAYFPDLNFNQMVLKAMFMGVALARIVGLERRRTSELARMAEDFASERRAAGRSVPADIGLLTPEHEHERATRIPE
ncbi:EboA domain-containing protein [Sorangium sp. So ce385]|uniref:EboA domain-containing protein n=1 Tax=Sorangium sp. So ce385 TaxID=3133308 RepID=UPI003F5BE281